MVKKEEKLVYKKLVALLDNPDEALGVDELDGFFHALAITPKVIMPDEWLPYLLGSELPAFPSLGTAGKYLTTMNNIYQRYYENRLAGKLRLPYRVDELEEEEFNHLLDWISGFCFGLLMLPDIWFPGGDDPPFEIINSTLAGFSLLQALLFPDDFIKSDEFRDLCDDEDPQIVLNEVMAFAMENLPAIIDLFQRYAFELEQEQVKEKADLPRLKLVQTETKDRDEQPYPRERNAPKGENSRRKNNRVIILDDFRRFK